MVSYYSRYKIFDTGGLFVLKLFDKVKNTVLTGCLYYTVVSLFMYALSLIIVQQQMVPTLKSLCMILAASLFVAALNNIFYVKKLSSVFRLLIHFTASAVAFYLIFILMSGISNNGGTVIIAFVMFAVLYAVIVLVSFFIRKAFSEKQINSSEYKNQFDNVNTKK